MTKLGQNRFNMIAYILLYYRKIRTFRVNLMHDSLKNIPDVHFRQMKEEGFEGFNQIMGYV